MYDVFKNIYICNGIVSTFTDTSMTFVCGVTDGIDLIIRENSITTTSIYVFDTNFNKPINSNYTINFRHASNLFKEFSILGSMRYIDILKYSDPPYGFGNMTINSIPITHNNFYTIIPDLFNTPYIAYVPSDFSSD